MLHRSSSLKILQFNGALLQTAHRLHYVLSHIRVIRAQRKILLIFWLDKHVNLLSCYFSFVHMI